MKLPIPFLMAFLLFYSNSSVANNIKDPIKVFQVFDAQLISDNPKGKLKIRFVSTADKSDTTNKPRGFFAKLKNVFNVLLDVSDNPPFRIEIVREKEKKY